MSALNLSKDNILIMNCCKINISSDEILYLDNLIAGVEDWGLFSKNIESSGFASLFYTKVKKLHNKKCIPVEIIERLEKIYFKNLSRNIIIYNSFNEIVRDFELSNIKIIALKGIYLAETLYKDIALRQLSDIDLLIEENDINTCIEILEKSGFRAVEENAPEFIKNNSEIVHYPPMCKGDVVVELHVRLHYTNTDYNLNIEKMRADAVHYDSNHDNLFTLSLYDLIIYTCIHLDKHFKSGHINFSSFADIVNLIDCEGTKIDWSGFVNRTKVHNCTETVLMYLVLAAKYFNATVPISIFDNYSYLADLKTEKKLIKYLNRYREKPSQVARHLTNISQLEGRKNKILYMLGLLFPPKEFMIKEYSIKKQKFYPVYYLYRYWVGLKGFLKLGINKLKKNQHK